MPVRLLAERWWLRTYGIKPWEMDRLPVEIFDWFPVIEQAEAESQRIQADQERRSSSPGPSGRRQMMTG